MGLHESKSQSSGDSESHESSLNGSISSVSGSPSSPISSPVDPRSPSENVARTPMECVLDSIQQSKKEMLLIDPRSPTLEFERTPIVISTVPKKTVRTLITNKNLELVPESEIRTPKIVPPKLLGNSPRTSVSANKSKRKSLVGLLETNIDYTETDLDEFEAQKRSAANTPARNHLEAVTEAPKPDEWETEEFKVEVALDSMNITEVPMETDEKKPSIREKSINITAHVKDLDKKLTNLIYHDESVDDIKATIIKTDVKLKDNCRTPLGNRNGNETLVKKSIGKLRVNDKPRKIESRIPIPKEKRFRNAAGQCENTPPQSMIPSKIRSTKWDTDRTLII